MAATKSKSKVPTKAEIQVELDEANERLQRMEAKLREEQSRTLEFATRDAGWLVTCPNEIWTGKKYGIPFLYGQCFIRKNQVVEYFLEEIEKISKGKLHKFMKEQMPIPPHTPKDHEEYEKAVRARESDPEYTTAFKAVVHLYADFGYKVEEFLPDQIAELEARMKQRADKARGMRSELMKERDQADTIIKPGHFGQPKPAGG